MLENDPLSNFVNKEMNSTVEIGKKKNSASKKSGKAKKLGLLNQSTSGQRCMTTGSGVVGGPPRRKTSAHSSSANAGHVRQVTLQPGFATAKLIPPSNS